jgi:hypothetical protein
LQRPAPDQSVEWAIVARKFLEPVEKHGLTMCNELPFGVLAAVRCAIFISATAAACFSQQGGTSVQDPPQANPGRPTISTPATLTPVGYLQFETGALGAWHSPEFVSQASINEVAKFSVSRRIELLAGFGPYVHSAGGVPANGTGDVDLGMQAVVHQGKGAHPTLAVGYLRQVHDGGTPNLDIGSAQNSVLLLLSADVKGFHYDTNYLFNEVMDNEVRRLQLGQTLSISHALASRFGITGEIWHFTQPFLRGRAVGNLWALNYNARPNLVLDAGVNRGLTSTSTRWEAFAGFTYLLPHRWFSH